MDESNNREIIYLQAIVVRGYRKPNLLERLTGRGGPKEISHLINLAGRRIAKAGAPRPALDLWVNLLTMAAVGTFVIVLITWYR